MISKYEWHDYAGYLQKQDAFGVTHFMWDGNRLLSEERGERQHIWIYEDESFVPLAQISTRRGESEHDAQVYWYHTDQAGLPRELTGVTGDIAWRADYRAWGNTLRVEKAEQAEPAHQPLRFQRQYYDAETGLHYNRFRYYDPDAGRFVSQDPIGLLGGVNLYQYAPNPLSWIDPLGLSGEPIGSENNPFGTSRAARREAMRQAGIPTSQQPVSQSRNSSGWEYRYEVPKKMGGGSIPATVQQQTMDVSHLDQPHWEAGEVKVDPRTGETRMNDYGRPKIANPKGKAYYKSKCGG